MLKKNQNCEFNEAFVTLIDLVPDVVVMIDAAGKIVAANKAFGKYMGYTGEELVGKNFLEEAFIDKENRSVLLENLKNRQSGSGINPCETKIKSKNGEPISLKMTGYNRIKYEGKTFALIIFHDNSEKSKHQNQLDRDLIEGETEFQALQKNEEKFREIANSVKDAIILVDQEARVTYWNPAAEVMFGYSSSEAIGKLVHELVVPYTVCKEVKARINSGVKDFAEIGAGYFTVGSVDLVGRHRDGSEFPVELTLSPVRLGGRWNAVGVVKCTSQRKQAEHKLQEAEQRYHTLFDQAPLGVLVVDPETASFVEFNDVAPMQLGYSREEFEKLTISDIEAEESKQEVRSHIAQIIKESSAEFETKQLTKDGAIKNVLVTVKTFKMADKIFLHSIFHDITEIRKVQNSLMESEARYRQLVELAQEGICALDSNLNIVFVNPHLAQILGYTESEVIGKSAFEFLDSNMIEQARSFLAQSKQGIKGEFEYEFLRKNGTRVYASIVASIISNDQGQPIGTLCLMADITERKRAEKVLADYSQKLEELVQERTEQLKKAQAELVKSERFAAIGEVAGMVGHDLRNPLTGIQNAAYYLEKKGLEISEAQAKEMLKTIEKCVAYSNRIVNDLLDYSKEIRLEIQESSLRMLLFESLAMIHVPETVKIINNLLHKKTLKVDPDKLKRVFVNLIKNAIDAMPNGGKITIDSREANGNMEIYFTDTGTGISDEVLQKLFSPLFTTKAQGMGFGLAICKRIVEAHGGTITVKPVRDKGTTFTVTLPIEQKPEVEGGEKVWINMPESLSSTMTKA
jgi:PAS domain S-box-containing protein